MLPDEPMIRPAALADATDIARVHVQAWRETYAGIIPQPYLDAMRVDEYAFKWRGWMSGRTTVHVAEEGDRVVGFTSCGPAHEDSPRGYDAEIYALYLLREFHGRGLGRALFDASRDTSGGRSLLVWVLERNPSRGFYEALGGREAARKTSEVGGAVLAEVGYGWAAQEEGRSK